MLHQVASVLLQPAYSQYKHGIMWSGLFDENVLPGDLVLHKSDINEHGSTAQGTERNNLSRSTTQAASRPENSIQSSLIPG